MSDQFTIESLIKKGYRLVGDAWVKGSPASANTTLIPESPLSKIKLGRPNLLENPIADGIEFGDGWCKIILAGVIKGLNGSGGLMQQHWAMAHGQKAKFLKRIAALHPPILTGKVKVVYTRFSIRYMDWDNMCATAKFPLDAIKNNKVIEDDSPEFIVEFIPKQEKCRRKDQRTEILITKLP